MNIFIFGSINMDLSIECARIPSRGETLQGRGFLESPGGKGANQAVAAAMAGARAYMIARVGADRMGAAVVASLQGYGVDTSYVCQDGSSTGVAIIVRSEGDNRIICDYGANHENDGDYAIAVLQKNAKAGDIFVTQLECKHEDVFAAIKEAKKLGMITIFNPAPAAALPEELYQFIDYIVVNQTECELLTGIYPEAGRHVVNDGVKAALEYFNKRGIAHPLITLGADGSVCFADAYLYQSAIQVEVVDTTAAGDTYIGAFASSLASRYKIDEAMCFAAHAAALAITKLGAQQSVPTFAEIKKFQKL